MMLRSPMGQLIAYCMVFLSSGINAQEKPVNAGIVVQVDALVTGKGSVFCDLYDNERGFPNKPAQALMRVKVQPERETATCVFPDVKAGRYAVAIWHDVNGDQKLDTNWVGVPSEPVGASNNAKGKLGPPTFQEAAFDYKPPLWRQNIRLE